MSKANSPMNNEQLSEENPTSRLNIYIRGFLLLAALIAIIYLILQNLSIFGNILIILIGFGAVILVHEFGHFSIAKLADIKVEAFSIFMPPIVLGLLKTKHGLRVRILPGFFPKPQSTPKEDKKQNQQQDEGLLTFTLGKPGNAGETEYRIGLIPLGGFVKMLGQEDTGASKSTDDPRSYANKSVGKRVAVISAGVLFNVLSAVIAFMMVFLMGIKMTPPIIGNVLPDSPAARAGLKPGDEIVSINNKSNSLDFSSIIMAAALSDEGEKLHLKVKRNYKELGFAITPKMGYGPPGKMNEDIKGLGITKPFSLTIADVAEPNKLQKRTALLPGDRIIKVNDRKIAAYQEIYKITGNTLKPYITITAERKLQNGQSKTINSKVNLDWLFAKRIGEDGNVELSHVCSMVPRLKIADVKGKSVSFIQKVLRIIGLGSKTTEENDDKLKAGDIILGINDVQFPTYKELSAVAEKHKDKKLYIKVLRTDKGNRQTRTVQVVPRYDSDANKVIIGIYPALDTHHPVVSKTIEALNGPEKLNIPRGALITAVNTKEVSSFYDIARLIHNNAGKKITINYKLDDKKTGQVTTTTEKTENLITVRPIPAELIPFKELKKTYKAKGPIDAIAIGTKKTVMFITQTYLTLKALVAGQVSPKSLMGPVGILTVSYKVVTYQPLIYYVYLMALISACIAVINFLPIPPFDGGHVVLLLIEKIKGSAISERTQGAIAYIGVVLIVALFLYLTFNDIVNFFIR